MNRQNACTRWPSHGLSKFNIEELKDCLSPSSFLQFVLRDTEKGKRGFGAKRARAGGRRREGESEREVARLAGIEPATLGFGGQYSIH